jgi:hypothetical protein
VIEPAAVLLWETWKVRVVELLYAPELGDRNSSFHVSPHDRLAVI